MPLPRKPKRGMRDLTKLGDTAGFKEYLDGLWSRYVSTTTSRGAPAPPSPSSGASVRTGPPVCPECGWPERDGHHGWLKTGQRVYDDKIGMTVDELKACPSCSGAVIRRRHFERYRALMVEARLPRLSEDWSFASFPPAPGKGEALHDAAAFGRGETRPAVLNLYLFGGFGVGKTGLAVSIVRARLAMEQPCLFWTVADLLTRIKATYDGKDGDTEAALIDRLCGVDLLALDDFGAERASEWQREKLYQILNRRMNDERETVFTSNLTLLELEERVGPRIVERIEYRCLPVEVGGANLRRDRADAPVENGKV